MRVVLCVLLLLSLVARCGTPPSDAYVRGGGGGQGVVLGNNAAGEACTAQIAGQTADVYCGSWRQPSGHVLAATASEGSDLASLATSSAWRAKLDTRSACGPPTSTTILNGQPALLMQCNRRIGGWPYVAIATKVGGGVWLADGVLPATPAIERAIGVLAGLTSASASAASSEADALLADRLAARAFGSNDIGVSDELMIRGSRANQAGNPSAAEHAYRSALAVQQKAFGQDDPRTSVTLTRLALQLSNQSRYAEADVLFQQAEKLAPRNEADPLAIPLVLQYRAMSDIQQGHMDEALRLLARAETGFATVVPSGTLNAHPAPAKSVNPFIANTLVRLSPLLGDAPPVRDPIEAAATDHVIEVRRYRSVALNALGRKEDAQAALASALDLERATGSTQSVEYARLSRNRGIAAASRGFSDEALSQLAASGVAFSRQLPGSRAVAETGLLRAGELVHAGRQQSALANCRDAVALLTALKAGARAELFAPCLDAYAAEATRDPGKAQTILAEMFGVSQLAQGSATVQQIARAAARLQEGARDEKVGAAIRLHDDAATRLSGLERQRDEFTQQARASGPGQADTTDLDKQIVDAQAALADAEVALQVASPNYGQLVQQVVSADDVFGALQPGEAFAGITVGAGRGWVFLLHDRRIDVARMDADADRIDSLVKRLRASVEPGTSGLPAFDTKTAHALYDATFGRLNINLAEVHSLTVAPTGALLTIPFEILLTADADPNRLEAAPWLVRTASISHVPSAGNFVALRRSAGGSRASQPWFGFGDFHRVTLAQAEQAYVGAGCAGSARALAELPPLPAATRELEAARVILHADKSAQLLGAAFTVDAVLHASLQNYRILHFATHAILPSDLACQRDPVIVASPPPRATDANSAMLSSNEILSMKLDADTVILSACDTGGLGGSVAGESLSDLARSFFYAGARSLLVTHWAVNDQAGAYLVASTLQHFAATPGEGMAGALRSAQLSVLADAGHSLPAEFAHPFYWAPFALIGTASGPTQGRGPTAAASAHTAGL